MSRIKESSVDIIIEGNIKTIVDGQAIKDAVTTAIQNHPSLGINIYIKNSFIMTSSVIGFLMKTIKVDKTDMHVHIGNVELYEMLTEMNLLDALHAIKDVK